MGETAMTTKPCVKCARPIEAPVDLDGLWQHTSCPEPDHDPVNNPAHYTTHPSGVEPIVIAETMGFCLGNVIKYVMRADLKGDAIEDLQKAEFYIKREIARREKEAKS